MTATEGSTMPWDPDRYLRFADHRARPGIELMARIPIEAAALIVDLGCGTGNLTTLLAERWPEARVIGVDSSEEMIDRARVDHPSIEFVVADVTEWEPPATPDIIYSNATLHWLDDHALVFGRLRSWLEPGGVLAVQMPDNWRAPTHMVPAAILDEGEWSQEAVDALIRDRVSTPHDYSGWVQPADVDLWRTTYYQSLSGADPVWAWTTGSVLRPVLAAMGEEESTRFESACKAVYAAAYPPNPDGTTTLPFTRLFLVATATRSAGVLQNKEFAPPVASG